MKRLILLLYLLALVFSLQARQLSFPGAEGFGKFTVGGRGGKVFEVTNLKDGGEGSLRAAVEAFGPRTVVFRVSGTIILNRSLNIKNPYITIAGQTAPRDGICLRKFPLIVSADQVIIRYIRVRLGDETGMDEDAVSGRWCKNVVMDHVSASWSVDETFSIYHCDSVTVQWCLISESLFNSKHVKGAHGFGGIAGSNNSTYHHNLFAHHSSRNPRIASGCGNFDFRNNVVYNWGFNSCYGGEQQQVGDSAHAFSTINLVANYFKPGPATKPGAISYRIANPSFRKVKTDYGKWFIAENYIEGYASVSSDNWNGGVQPQEGMDDLPYVKLINPWPSMPIRQQTAEQACSTVLENVGATLPKRDAVDARVVRDTQLGQATCEGSSYKKDHLVAVDTEKCGMIDSPADVGGWPELKSMVPPMDSDHDGMPDEWEKKYGTNPLDPTDGNAIGTDGYTKLENYLNRFDIEQTTYKSN